MKEPGIGQFKGEPARFAKRSGGQVKHHPKGTMSSPQLVRQLQGRPEAGEGIKSDSRL